MLHLFNWFNMQLLLCVIFTVEYSLFFLLFEIPVCFWYVPDIIRISIRNELTSMEIAQSNTFTWTYFCFFHASILRLMLLLRSNNVHFDRIYIVLFSCQVFEIFIVLLLHVHFCYNCATKHYKYLLQACSMFKGYYTCCRYTRTDRQTDKIIPVDLLV